MAETTAGQVRGSIAAILHRSDHFLGAVAYYPLFLAAYVVLQAYVNNLGNVPAWDALITLLVVLAVTAVAFALVSLLYRDTRRAAVPVALGAVTTLGYGYMTEALAPYWSGTCCSFSSSDRSSSWSVSPRNVPNASRRSPRA